MLNIWVFGIGVRDDIDGVASAVGWHVGSSVEFVDVKTLTFEFGEGRLAQMDREVAIVMASPGEGSTNEVVDVTHEVNLKFGLKYFLEEILLSLTCGVEHKIVHI